LGREEVTMLGAGLTTTLDEADLVRSAAEVAVTLTVRLPEMAAGGL